MNYLNVVIAFIITLLLTLLITPLIIKLSKKFGVVDKPNDRKKHNGEIPLLGGLAIIIPVIIGLLYLQPIHYSLTAIILGAVIIIGIGILDYM